MLQAAVEVVAQFVLEVVCGMTGHGLLWAMTLGRWKALQSSGNVAMIVGLLFWVSVGVGLYLLLA